MRRFNFKMLPTYPMTADMGTATFFFPKNVFEMLILNKKLPCEWPLWRPRREVPSPHVDRSAAAMLSPTCMFDWPDWRQESQTVTSRLQSAVKLPSFHPLGCRSGTRTHTCAHMHTRAHCLTQCSVWNVCMSVFPLLHWMPQYRWPAGLSQRVWCCLKVSKWSRDCPHVFFVISFRRNREMSHGCDTFCQL